MTVAGVEFGFASSTNVSQSTYVVPSEKYHRVDGAVAAPPACPIRHTGDSPM